jgi:hypothetical protein
MLGSTIMSNIRMQSRFWLEAKDRQVLLLFNMSWIGYIVTAGFLSVLYYPHIFVLAGINLAALNILRMKYASISKITAKKVKNR